jgi:uncharacterized protein involved in exopolysaccharide biosynthesis
MDDPQGTTPDSELLPQANEVESDGAEEAGESLGLKIARFLRTYWARRRIAFGILAAGILASVLYALSLPAFYTSTTTLLPPAGGSPMSGIMNLLSPASTAMDLDSVELGIETRGDLYVAIMGSRNVQDDLINRFGLANYYKSRLIENTRKSLAAATKIEQDRKSGIITISVTAGNPVLASNIAAGYVEELNRVMTDNSASTARRERIFLEGRVKDIKDKLDESAKELSQFSAKNRAIDMPSQPKSMLDEGLRLQAELIEGRSQLAALRQTYSEDNLRVRALEAHNAELQHQLDKMGGMPHGSGTNSDANDSPYPTADELPSLGLTYYDLERKMHVEEALWEALTKEYEAAKVEEAAEIPTVRVLDAAEVPGRKSGPSRRFIVEVGAMLSFAVTLIVVLVGMIWEGMDPQDEPKRLITGVIGTALHPRRWF